MSGPRDAAQIKPPSPFGAGSRGVEWFLVALGSLAMLAGTAAGTLIWYYGDSSGHSRLRAWGIPIFTAVFFLFGLRMLLMGLPLRRWRAGLRLRGGGEAWGEGYRWRRRARPLPGGEETLAEGLVGVAALAAFGMAINLVWFDLDALRGSRLLAFILIPLFTAIIAFIVGASLLEAGRRLLAGPARLRFLDYPATPGGPLRLEFAPPRGASGKGEVVALLRCLEERPLPRGGEGRFVEAVAMTVFTLAAEQGVAAPGGVTPLTFRLPEGIPLTALRPAQGPRRWWVVEIRRTGKGGAVGAAWNFLAPVYGRATM